jgi:hypothetical protein
VFVYKLILQARIAAELAAKEPPPKKKVKEVVEERDYRYS